MKHMKFN